MDTYKTAKFLLSRQGPWI